jgi:hypothetical protein
MSASSTKSGTGSGALLVISATPATVASPAPYPAAPPTAFLTALTSPPTANGIPVLYLKEYSIPEQKYAYDKITNLNSPSVLSIYGSGSDAVVEEVLPTVIDPGTFSATGIFDPSDPGLLAIQAAWESGLPNAFQIQLPKIGSQTTTGDTYAFNAFVDTQPNAVNVSVDKAVTVKISLKLNSIMTVAQGS